MEVDSVRRYPTVSSLAIVVVLLLVGVGLPWVDQHVPGTQSLPPGLAYHVGGGVEIVPPPGSSVDVSKSRPGRLVGKVIVLYDGGRIRFGITVEQRAQPLPDAAGRLARRLTSLPGVRVHEGTSEIRTDAGIDGLQGSYENNGTKDASAPTRGGLYAVFVLAGAVTVEVVVVGPASRLERDAEAVRAVFTSVALRRVR